MESTTRQPLPFLFARLMVRLAVVSMVVVMGYSLFKPRPGEEEVPVAPHDAEYVRLKGHVAQLELKLEAVEAERDRLREEVKRLSGGSPEPSESEAESQ